jgi:hypothetical protein
MAPRDLGLSLPSPRGKKNFRGAPRLRQIDRGNLSLTQVRPNVRRCGHTVATWRQLGNGRQRPGKQTRAVNPDNGSNAVPRAKASDASGVRRPGVALQPVPRQPTDSG